MLIRAASVTDAGRIAAIYAHHVRNGTATFDTAPVPVAAMADKIGGLTARGCPFLVAEADDAVVGYAYAAPFRDRPAYAATAEDSIYIDPEWIGRGVGKALLLALIEASETAGFRQMIAVAGGGEPASVALHAACGFAETGRMVAVGRKFGRWLDTVYMQRALGAGAETPPASEPGVSIRPIHIAYRIAQRLRMLWWRVARPHVYGAKVVVLGPDRTVLLIRHSYVASGQWMLPGGGVRRGEDAAVAAVREVREETGVTVTALRLHGAFLDRSRGAHNHISLFVGDGTGAPRCDGREVVAAEWHPIDALPDTLAAASRKRIVEVRDGRGPADPDW